MYLSRLLYGITVFAGASLLFLVEPMAAKQLLPTLGGSSAVWLTCLVFFQLTLLLGYLYAHWLTRDSAPKWRRQLYLISLVTAVILLVTQQIHPGEFLHGSDHPVTAIFRNLTISIGLPFLLLGATSPLLQVWFLRVHGGEIPYRLFALSNVGSLLALIAYPVVVEPNLTLKHQRILWSVGFVAYVGLCFFLALQPALAQQPISSPEEPIAPRTRAATQWLWLDRKSVV